MDYIASEGSIIVHVGVRRQSELVRQRVQQLQALMAGASPALHQQSPQPTQQAAPPGVAAPSGAAPASLLGLGGLRARAATGGLDRREAEALALGALEADASDEGSGDDDDDLASFGSPGGRFQASLMDTLNTWMGCGMPDMVLPPQGWLPPEGFLLPVHQQSFQYFVRKQVLLGNGAAHHYSSELKYRIGMGIP
jgi:hypothetical protein